MARSIRFDPDEPARSRSAVDRSVRDARKAREAQYFTPVRVTLRDARVRRHA